MVVMALLLLRAVPGLQILGAPPAGGDEGRASGYFPHSPRAKQGRDPVWSTSPPAA